MWIIAQDGTAFNMNKLHRIGVFKKYSREYDEAHLYTNDGSGGDSEVLFVGTLKECNDAKDVILFSYVEGHKLVDTRVLPATKDTRDIPF